MSVTNGSNGMVRLKISYSTMLRNRDFFSVGEKFWYTPLAAPETEVLIEVVEKPENMDAVWMCNNLCGIREWCCRHDNYDSRLVNYIPECNLVRRKDNKRVYFKEITRL